jgi:Domain of unknown function (DUF4157)
VTYDRTSSDGDHGGSGGAAGAGSPGKVARTQRLVAPSRGAPLPDGVRSTFEGSLGTDLGGVRVHTDDASAGAASALGARAFASGDDIHFGAGQYAPADPFGVHLLAHEVAHTVQQRGGGPAAQAWRDVSEPGDAGEVEADVAADAMVSGRPAAVTAGLGAGVAIQRDTKPAATPAAASWVVPFGYGTATTKAMAGRSVDYLDTTIDDIKEYTDTANPSELQAVYDFVTRKQELVDAWAKVKSPGGADGPLTADDATTLRTVGAACEKTILGAIGAIVARVDAAAAKIDAQRVAEEDQLAEALHVAFLDGAVGTGKTKVTQLKAVVDQVSKLNAHLTKVTGWAAKVPGAGVKTASEFLSKYGKPINEKVSTAIEVADILTDWANLDSANAGAFKAANALKVGLKTIDFGMKFTKAVPLIGDLWSKYYKPALESCLATARKLYLGEEAQGRDVALLEWLQQPKVAGVTPKIGKGLDQYFPGGQPVLDVMYPIVNGGAAVLSPAAKTFFLARTDWFDKGTGNGGALSDCKNDHDIVVWLTWQSNVVWSALYGSLPKTLS